MILSGGLTLQSACYRCVYRTIHLLLSACAYISTGWKQVPNSKVCLILNNSPQIGSALHLELYLDMKMAVFLQDDFQHLIKSSWDKSQTCT